MLKELKKYKIFIFTGLAVAFAVAGIAAIIYFILYPSGAQFHSDCTDTIYWANASYESGKLYNPDFRYAALLPFGGTIIMLPFIHAFGVSMAAQASGMITFALLFFAGIYFVCRCAGFEIRHASMAIGVMAFTLSLSEKLREIFWCHIIYYSLASLFIFVLLGLVLRALGSLNSKGYILYTALAAGFACLVANDSFQIIVTSTVPVILAVIAEKILDGEHKLSIKSCIKPLVLVAAVFSASVVGVAVAAAMRNGISAGYENAYSNYSAPDKWLDHLMIIPSHWLSLLGVDIKDGDPLFSLESIIHLLKLGFATLLGVIPIIALCNYKRFDSKGKILLLTHWALTAVIIFAVVFGSLSSANWRLSPLVVTSLLVCLCFFRTCFRSVDMLVLKRISALALALFLLCSALGAYSIKALPKDGKAENEAYKLGTYLKDRGLTYGYATFWNSQSTTLLTDSAVKVRSITVDENGISPYYYQSSSSWFDAGSSTGDYFIVLGEADVATLAAHSLYYAVIDDAENFVEYESYLILIYDSNPFAQSKQIPEKNQ